MIIAAGVCVRVVDFLAATLFIVARARRYRTTQSARRVTTSAGLQ